MSYNNPSGTPNFVGYDPLNLAFTQTEQATQVGAWQGPVPIGWTKPFSVLEALPSQAKCFITGNGVTAPTNLPQQASGTISLSGSGGSLQLTAHTSTPQNVNTDPPVGKFTWATNSPTVATVSSSGLVTLLKKGFVTIEARYPRQVSISFPSVPNPTDFCYATVDLQVVS
jgi:hypothetical protein